MIPEPQPLPMDAPPQTIGFAPHQPYNSESMMSKHLDTSDILIRMKNTLLGLEYDEEDDEWKPAMKVIGYNEAGEEVRQEEGPLMDPQDIRITIAYLQGFLNPNTFLSKIKEEEINDIMWDVSKKLAILFYNLKRKLSPHIADMLWGMIEYPILLGLKRADGKITLDAISKSQQTHEVIQQTPTKQQQGQESEFNPLGGW